MSPSPAAPHPSTGRATPDLDRLLARLRRRLVGQVWLHGAGRTLFCAGAWLLYMFLADWSMHLPAGVRAVHLGVLIALPLAVAYRELYRRLAWVPGRAGLAVLVERAHPDLHELLVSAVQLGAGGGCQGDSDELIGRVLREAEQRAATLDLERALEPARPRRTFAAGFLGTALAAAVMALDPAAARTFLERIAGGATPWPQRTHLTVEIPIAGAPGQADSSPEEIRVRVARGTDVPVVVRAAGLVPDDVTLHFESGNKTVLAAGSGRTFRTLLRSRQEDCVFHVTGGDDRDGLPRVTITVLQPPDVAGLALRVEPPAYSGLPARLERDRDVEVLAGSRVTVHVLPDPPEATGAVRLLPEDRLIALEPRPFPPPAAQGPGADPAQGSGRGAALAGLAFELVAQASLRYRFELEDATGLSNPDPGLFAIHVRADREPAVELVAPGRAEVETVVAGALPLRALASDDFGLTGMTLSVAPPDAPDANDASGAAVGRPGLVLELEWSEPPADGGPAPADVRARGFAARRLELADLLGGAQPLEGQLLTLTVEADDNRQPAAQRGSSAPIRVRVVSADEYLRRVQDRLARARGQVGSLGELMREKHDRALELLAALESDQPGSAVDADGIALALTGQRRVHGDARALSRELAAVAEGMIYSRLDERAGALLEELDRRQSTLSDRRFHAQVWSGLAGLVREKQLGDPAFAGRLVEIVGLALEISEGDAASAAEELRRAQDALELSGAHAALSEAVRLQAAGLARAERLLELLAEWDNFQSVLALTRDILNRQRTLLERTRQYAKDN